MRLVLVVATFPKLSETFIVSKFLGLLERGWDVHLVCTRVNWNAWDQFPRLIGNSRARHRVHGGWPHQPRALAVLLGPFVLLGGVFRSFRRTFRYFAQGWKRYEMDVFRRYYLDAAIVQVNPDLIHFEFGALAVGRMDLKDLLGCKVTASFRGYDLNFVGLDTPNYYQEVWTKADALHFLGDDLWQRALARGCLPDKPHRLIPPAIDTDFFRPNGTPRTEAVSGTRPLRILSVGRMDWRKGYEYALQAIRLLKDRDVPCEYTIIGEGDFLEAVSFARHQLGLETVVDLVGALPREKVKSFLEWADVFLHAAVSEGFSNAVIEAQAMGIPVVCTDAGGLPENVVDGETGFIVPRREARALADKLQNLAEDAALRQKMREAGRQRTLTRFQLTDQLNAFEDFFLAVNEEPD